MATVLDAINSQKAKIQGINDRITAISLGYPNSSPPIKSLITVAQNYINGVVRLIDGRNAYIARYPSGNASTNNPNIGIGSFLPSLIEDLNNEGWDQNTPWGTVFQPGVLEKKLDIRNANLAALKAELAKLQGVGPESLTQANNDLAALNLQYQREVQSTAYANMTPAERIAADKAVADAKLAADKAAADAQQKKTVTYIVIFVVVAIIAAFIWKKVL